MNNLIKERINESINTKQTLLNDKELLETIDEVANKIAKAIKTGNKLVICGNGGSASDALHFAGEIVGRFQKERNPWPAIVLNADVTTMTAIANDYGFDKVFARQAKAHVNKGDIFVGISTSGNSLNVSKAIKVSKDIGATTIGLLGKDGGKIKDIVDYSLIVPSNITARIQESHILIIHIICELVEDLLNE